MPRRRMIDPGFWDNTEVAKLTRDERLLVLGCLNNADDDGRLKAHPAYLKAAIFMYDNDLDPTAIDGLKQSTLAKMISWSKDNFWRMQAYHNAGEEYLYFPNWPSQQKPSHPTPSRLPAPPAEISGGTPVPPTGISRDTQEELAKDSGVTPSQSSLGQSSLGKVSIGQVRVVQEDFTKFLDSETDLTDFLTTTIEKYMPRGPTWAMEAIKQFWQQATGKPLTHSVFEVIFSALPKYQPKTVARLCVKAAKYTPGKTSPAKYMQKILEDIQKTERPP